MIFIDNRGKGEKEIADLLIAKHYPVEVRYIESGDIIINGEIGIERKTVNDLTGTLFCKQKGHNLWIQIETLKNTYQKTLMIIEGYVNYNDKILNSVITSILVGWQIPIIFTTNTYETAKRIGNIFDKYGCSKTSNIPPAAVKKEATPKRIRWAMLQCIAGIGAVTATRILEENPYIFSANDKTHSFNIKGLNKNSKELLVRVLRKE